MLAVCHVRDLYVEPTAHPRGRAFLSAASGLVQVQGRLYVVADDEHYLAMFDAIALQAPGRLIRLFEGDLPEVMEQRKALKPDLEALTLLPTLPGAPSGAMLGLGSGSHANRNTGVLIHLGPEGGLAGNARLIDLTPLYSSLRIEFSELNIEGALFVDDELLLLQRGNKALPLNACIHFAWAEVMPWLLGQSAAPLRATAVRRYDLGMVDGIPLCFTDGAALPGGEWVFSAVAENVADNYNDGAFVGASIGIVDARGAIRFMQALAPAAKVEGIAAQLDGDALMLTMVTDGDDPALPSQLLSAKLSLAYGQGGL
jgi:hypothetical protein